MRWHFLRTPHADGASNMALDEALMRRAARTGDAVFRVYGWSAPTLSLGRNQRARGCYDDGMARELGVAFVRRPTGGRALLHHHEVTYSATMPLGAAKEARAAYDFVNDVLLAALGRLGVAAGRAENPVHVPPGLRPCFDVPSEREIVLDGRKLIGSAQWRRDGALLQHGSILIRDDQPLITRLMKEPQGSPPSAGTLSEALRRDPSLDDVAVPILEALEAAVGAPVEALSPDAPLESEVEQLRVSYADDAWTWRR
jgi:lipoyl(octanoyl) transferase